LYVFSAALYAAVAEAATVVEPDSGTGCIGASMHNGRAVSPFT
jgi:hypothetical protein